MKRAAILPTLTLGLGCLLAQAQSTIESAQWTPGEIVWNTAASGVEVIDLAGDDQAAGLYAYRVRFPEGFRNQPHFHPDDRIVTVISGTLEMGYGELFDEAALKALPAGSVWTEPRDEPHFVWARDGEVVIQVIGHGPSGTTQVETPDR